MKSLESGLAGYRLVKGRVNSGEVLAQTDIAGVEEGGDYKLSLLE